MADTQELLQKAEKDHNKSKKVLDELRTVSNSWIVGYNKLKVEVAELTKGRQSDKDEYEVSQD